MTNAFTPPLLAPDLQRKKFELERAAQMGRALMEDGSQMPQGQMVSGHYVAPSWAQYAGQLLKSYVGGRAMNSIPDRMADIQKSQQDYEASLFAPQRGQGAVTGTDLQRKQMEFQQNQMLAKALMQQGMQPNEGRMISGHYVRPDAGRAIANAFSLYAGMKGMQDAPQQMADLQKAQQDHDASLFGFNPSSQQLAAALDNGSAQALPVTSQPDQDQVQGAGPAGGPSRPINENAAQLGRALSGQSVMPLLPGRDAQQSLMAYRALGPEKYMESVLRQGEPTQIQRILLAAGLRSDDPEYQRILRETVDPRFMSPYQQQSLALQRRGQDVSVANSVRSYNSGAYSAPNQSTAGFFRVGPGGVEILTDPNTGAPLMPVTADPSVRGMVAEAEASGKERGKSLAESRINAPEALASVDNMLSTIDTVLDHRGLDFAVGPYLGQKAPLVPDAIDFEAKREQLQGQVFLRAYQDLKGGGAITEPEGAKAEASLGNLSRAQTPEQFRSALKSLKDVVVAAKDRLKAKAAAPISGQKAARRFNPATGRIE